MAQATEAPASSTAEGPTSHTQNQDGSLLSSLTAEQFAKLLEEIYAHLAQAQPNRNTFGYTRAEQIEALHKLREPFPESEIRYLPRVWCKACRDAKGTCNRQDHERRQCRRCGQSMTTAHIDLKFVGHAEATNRLLNVDPFWDWEPLTTDQAGLPQYDQNRGLWIRLTVCGVTRLGYGNAEGKSGGDAVKEIIGDAIRNAGMRFGMALDLWTTSDLEIIENGGDPREQDGAGQPGSPSTSQQGRGPAGESKDGVLDKLYLQAIEGRFNPLVLTQVRGAAAKEGVLECTVDGPPPERQRMEFREFLDLLETAVKQQQKGAA